MSTQPPTHPTRRPWRRRTIASLIAGLAATLGAGLAHAHGGFGWGGWHRGADQDPQVMQKRTEARVKWMLADVGATEAQEKKIAAIMTAAITDLRPLRQQAADARREAMQLLAQPQIDRNALEALRAKQAQALEQVSRRMTQSLADAAEVLTPEQRAKLAQQMENRWGRRHGRG